MLVSNDDEAPAVAQVVCRALGYGGGIPRFSGWYGVNGTATPLIWLPKCLGGEASLEKCSFARAGDEGPRPDTLGVACAGEQAGR